MTDLKALAARCVDLDGPSYAMDCEIWDAVYPGERQARFQKLNAPGSPYHGRLHPFDMDGYVKPLKSFTASIDAALSLARNGDEADALMFRARKNIGEDFNLHVSLWERTGLPYAPTLARYVTAAALLMRSE